MRDALFDGRRRVVLALLLVGVALGCAKEPEVLEPLPRHPFPRWVEKLEVGQSDVESVTKRFGPPDELEQSVYGGVYYRYRYAEPMWPDDDPDRPIVGANGRLERRPKTRADDVDDRIHGVGDWLDWLLFYPPRQPRPAAKRWIPATIHDLELQFDPDGKLARFRYAPEDGRTAITASR
jgi:hypothetical protein